MRTASVLIAALAALAGGIAGFQLGVASNVGAAGGTVYLGGGLFPGFGFLFFLFFVLVLVAAFGGRRRGPWGYGPGRWSGSPSGAWGDPGDPRRQWIADAHRRLHEEDAPRATSDRVPPPPAAS